MLARVLSIFYIILACVLCVFRFLCPSVCVCEFENKCAEFEMYMVCWLRCGASVYVSVCVRVSVSVFVSEFEDLCVELMVSILC